VESKLKKPDWIRVKAPVSKEYQGMHDLMRRQKLNTVCEEAACPNVGECWGKRHATIMILGSTCTRACTFCNIKKGRPDLLDPHEPERVAEAVGDIGLRHVVITSVDRDDLKDGGAEHFAPDFLRKEGALERVIDARPDVYNHNLETVPRLYREVRPVARYFHSLRLLQKVKDLDPSIFTKSGIMVGLGEETREIYQVMDDLRTANVDFMTIGQYLQPTPKHRCVDRFVTPDEFEEYAKKARGKGFLMVSSSALTRSSYHAGDDFVRLKVAREAQLAN